ncbi:purine-binding chemotaxis protein CheW [Roseateles asaccharophilus]|uniref:chemotaxis protein CheW n=1 Tax=Roseateles asaccharophilus TaxID=582607 RepID=UPI00383405F7
MIDGLRQLLTFRLSEESYGISLDAVQEIRSYTEPTKLRSAPTYMSGVIELRGAMVPVVDLRAAFSMRPARITNQSVIVVLLVGDRNVGLLIDQVDDVADVGPGQERAVPGMVHLVDTMCLQSIVATNDRMILVVDHLRLVEKLGVLTALTKAHDQLEAA